MIRSGVLLAACIAFVACSGGPPDATPTAEAVATGSPSPVTSPAAGSPAPTSPPPVATQPPAAEGLYVRNRSDAAVVVRLRGSQRRDVLVPAGRTGLLLEEVPVERPSERIRVDVYDGRCRRRLDRLGMVNDAMSLVDIDARRDSRLLAGADAEAVARPGVAMLEATDRC